MAYSKRAMARIRHCKDDCCTNRFNLHDMRSVGERKEEADGSWSAQGDGLSIHDDEDQDEEASSCAVHVVDYAMHVSGRLKLNDQAAQRHQ